MSLKPKLANNIGLILAGGFFAWCGIGLGLQLGGFWGLPLETFGLLGVLWLSIGSVSLIRRRNLTIVIDDSGIELPAFKLFQKNPRRVLLGRENIAHVSKHESLKGRLIEIVTKGGDKIFVEARNYCSLDDFITYCRQHELPVA
jgi:hypothetical protein